MQRRNDSDKVILCQNVHDVQSGDGLVGMHVCSFICFIYFSKGKEVRNIKFRTYFNHGGIP